MFLLSTRRGMNIMVPEWFISMSVKVYILFNLTQPVRPFKLMEPIMEVLIFLLLIFLVLKLVAL